MPISNRGTCPVCGETRSLKNGKIRQHAGAPDSATPDSGVPALANSTRAYCCEGTGQLPAELQEPEQAG